MADRDTVFLFAFARSAVRRSFFGGTLVGCAGVFIAMRLWRDFAQPPLNTWTCETWTLYLVATAVIAWCWQQYRRDADYLTPRRKRPRLGDKGDA
jgi:hypothetical protein